MLRTGMLTAVSAAVVCLGGVLVACGGGGPGGGYTAVGAGQGGPRAVAPSGSVTLVPLDRRPRGAGPATPAHPGTPRSAGPASPPPSASETASAPAPAPTGETTWGTPRPRGGPGGRTTPPAASPSPAPSRTTPAPAPADLSWGDPATEDTGERWCQKVTVGFRNAGGTAVRSGSVTFGTHIIGALGVDWGTVESTVELPVPLAPGARRSPAWTVCVDAWRVPLGMHIETRDVSVEWA
ncbi:hypothetical protein [Streptomyces cinerochromogenes]|uniref:hypothetical protein n=1 Tax=Streptomyces cinerochromogenes TaxID=66422 RepID=UPI0016709F1D|nr:hypothetical protein [Streptomyces cinerochromogenes]GGS59266.1 hypothetical protein GCM10010206_21560 [Streptomyces cinerochromogenes]